MRSWPSLPVIALLLLAGSPAAAGTLFVTNTKSDSVSVIDTDTFEVTATIPVGRGKPNRIVFHPDGKLAWIVYDKSHDLGVIDAETRKLVKRVKIGGNPYNRNFTPDGRHLLMLDWSSDTIAVPGIVHESTLTPDGRFLYTTLRKGNRIVVVDTATDKIVTTIAQKGYPDLVTMEPNGRYALVTNRWADLVSVIDLTTHTHVRTIPVGKAPHGMALPR